VSRLDQDKIEYGNTAASSGPARAISGEDHLRAVTEMPQKRSRAPDGRKERKRPEAGRPDSGPSDNETDPPALKPRKKTIVIAAIATIALITAGGWYYLSTKDIESTDDAQVAGNAVTIAPKVSGQITELAVSDNQRVKSAI